MVQYYTEICADMKKDINFLLNELSKLYPDAHCELNYGTNWQLLVSVILSAQCTDKRVNQVTPLLFAEAPEPADFIAMPIERLEKLIYSCGFYHNKAKNIKAAAKDVTERFGGEVPGSIEELVTIAGVGRKTANVVFAVGFGGQAMPVDTHVFRIAHRLGLSDGKTPTAVEKELRAVIPEERYTEAHHLFIFHGRYRCKSLRPDCADCPIKTMCAYDGGKN